MPVKDTLKASIPPDLANRVRNAVYFTPGLTLSALTAEALLPALRRLERAHGGRFPQRPNQRLPAGRPASS